VPYVLPFSLTQCPVAHLRRARTQAQRFLGGIYSSNWIELSPSDHAARLNRSDAYPRAYSPSLERHAPQSPRFLTTVPLRAS
jgi:hypothetical protein